jgi:hypothetical protein
MSTITAILEPDADGTVHLPVPPELQSHGKLRVTARIAVVAESSPASRKVLNAPKATPEMIARRMKALEELRTAGGLSDVIPDPVEWQREIRRDRPLPGRE